MNVLKTTFLPMLLISFSFHSFAKAQSNVSASSVASFVDTLRAESARVEDGKRLKLDESVRARVYSQLNDVNGSGKTVQIPMGTEFEVLEISDDGKVAHVGIDTDVSSNSDIYLSIEDLQSAHLTEMEDTDGEEGDDEVADDGLFAGKKKRGGRGSGMTYCYRDVKKTMVRTKKCGRYASGSRAAEAISIVPRECGYKKVGIPKNLSKLPVGSICVSGGGRPCGGGLSCGHIAIKLASGMWFGAGTRATPFLPDSKKKGYKHRFALGCMTPSGSKKK